jgi:hypothetical protein
VSPATAVRRRTRKPKGTKRVSYELIKSDSPTGEPVYRLLRDISTTHHEHLNDARIALAWCTSWKPDVDGFRVVAKCVRASDLHRELAPFDLVVLLLKPLFQDAFTTDTEKRRMLDRALCHAQVRLDERTGEPVYDERGRKVYRLRKAPIQEFPEIIQRYGFDPRNADLQRVAREAVQRAQSEVWTACEACRNSPNGAGWVSVVENGVHRVKKCDCLVAFGKRRAEVQAMAS